MLPCGARPVERRNENEPVVEAIVVHLRVERGADGHAFDRRADRPARLGATRPTDPPAGELPHGLARGDRPTDVREADEGRQGVREEHAVEERKGRIEPVSANDTAPPDPQYEQQERQLTDDVDQRRRRAAEHLRRAMKGRRLT